MRGCLTFIITAIILVAFGGTALAAIVVLVPILLGDQDAESLADLHWYTWTAIIILPIILLKILVKASRITANYICDMLGIDWKSGILTEDNNFFAFSVVSLQRFCIFAHRYDLVSFRWHTELRSKVLHSHQTGTWELPVCCSGHESEGGECCTVVSALL